MTEQEKSLIEWYAHAAEITDRIIVESLKAPELQDKAMRVVGDDPAQVQAFRERLSHQANTADGVADQQRSVLLERLSKYNGGKDIAELIMAVVAASVNTATVARFENKKREEQAKPNEVRNAMAIAAYDAISRDACEKRAIAKRLINETLKRLLSGYDYPAEVRTF